MLKVSCKFIMTLIYIVENKFYKEPDNVNAEPKQTYDEYEDDEYDSEMDDFIDDEEYDDNENNSEKKDYSKCIQEIFNYNPKRYKTIEDDDLDDMETDYHSQLKEEKRRWLI